MVEIEEKYKKKIGDFIKENDLDYSIIDNGLSKFSVVAFDGVKFTFFTNEDKFIIVKYDKNKDRINDPGSKAYDYYSFNSISQILEQLSFYDNSIQKSYWDFILDTTEVGFMKDGYVEDWYKEFMSDDESWGTDDYETYKTLTYSNNSYKPELKSPFNNIHEVSPINDLVYTKIDKLYFEIHPVSCSERKETYLLKLSCNNEEVLKEYINYIVYSKKGLKLLLETIFRSMDQYK